MTLTKIILAAGAMLTLAAPAAALADPYWGHDRGHHEGWREHDGWRGGERDWDRPEWRGPGWRGPERRGYEGWARPARYVYDGPSCTFEHRGFYNGYGYWVSRPVRVCYR